VFSSPQFGRDHGFVGAVFQDVAMITVIDQEALAMSRRQGGAVSRGQALAMGFSTRQIQHRVARGLWKPVGRQGYLLLPPVTHLDRVRAAVALLPQPVVSHQSAAEIHGFGRVDRGMAVVTVHTRTTHSFPGVVVHRAHDYLDSHVETTVGLPVTTVARTCVDLAAILTPGHLGVVIDDLVAAGRVRVDDLVTVVEAVCRRGRAGSASIRAYLSERVGETQPGSVLEMAGRRLLAQAGLPPPLSEFPVPWEASRRFDDAYPDHKLAIEWDSRRFHLQMDAFAADRRRDRGALVHGWRVLRFTWSDVTGNPASVVADVRRVLAHH
jgi:hypothetical protein